jgi:hypothetical protein
MPQADSPDTTIPSDLCKPGCACPDCLAIQEAEVERLGPEREPVENMTELQLLERDLRDCFEGCIPFHEAIEMIGAPDQYLAQLRADYRRWKRHFDASLGG